MYFGPATIFRVKPCIHLCFIFAQPIYKEKNDVLILEYGISLNLQSYISLQFYPKTHMNFKMYAIFRILTIIFRLGEDA